MADIRINALATTAASTASDDFIAVDGSANGTRKLNAYSPTFGGNVTASGNLTVSGGQIALAASSSTPSVLITQTDSAGYSIVRLLNTGGTAQSYDFAVGGSGTGSLAQKFYIYDSTAGAVRLAIAPTTGNLILGTTSDAASGARLQAQLTGTDGTVSTLLSLRKNTNSAGTGVAIDFIPESTDVPLAKLSAVRTNVNNGYTDFRFSTWNGSTLVEQLRLVGQTGNFLIGTNVDSSALLQVGTNTTTAAGGMKFGTDTALFRSAAGALQLETSATAVFEIDGGAGNTRGVVIQAAGTEQAAITVAASGTSLLLSTGSPRTTALTLDSDQNATFAKKISANGSTTWASASSAQVFWNTGSGANLAGSGSSYDVSVLNKNGDLAFYVPTGTQNTIFAGNIKTAAPSGGTAATWRLGTVASVSPTSPNRTIEVEIGGTTYYIHAKTTNN